MTIPGMNDWQNTSNNNGCGCIPTITWFPCGCSPIRINSTDVIYTGADLVNSGILTNDNLTQALAKIDAIISSGGGFTLTDGNGTLAGATFVNWGGTLTSDVSISGYHNITLGNGPALQSFSAHVTDFAVTTLLDLLLSGLGYIEIRNAGVGVYDESITLTSGGISLLYTNSISSKQTIVNVGDNFVKISSTDSSFPGATYDINYGVNFTTRSLIDKNYADIHLTGLTFTNSPSNGNVPTYNGTNWTFSTPSGGSGITVGTTTITSGTTGRIPYNNAGIYSETANLSWDGFSILQVSRVQSGGTAGYTSQGFNAVNGEFQYSNNGADAFASFRVSHFSSVGGLGTGVSIDFGSTAAAGNEKLGGNIGIVATNVGVGTEAFDFVINLMTGGAAATEIFRFVPDGTLKTPNNGAGTSGQLIVKSGTGTTGSGFVELASGATSAGTSGGAAIVSGTGTTGSGTVGVISGPVSAGASGQVSVTSGNGTTGSGQVLIISGNASAGNSGDIIIQCGSASGSVGAVIVQGRATGKLSFYGNAGILQPTTAGAASSFSANAGTAINDASTFDGYTLKQVVAAIRLLGLLA